MKKLIFIIFTFSLTYGQFLSDENFGFSGGPTMKSEQLSNQSPCISMEERTFINQNKLDIVYRPTSRDAILFDDPMGNGGINSFGKTVINYVDLNPANSLLDYNCGQITYNTHQGTDIEILNFYEMDEGVTILCSAPGIVTYTHDGEYDRNTEWINGANANAVIVSHSDGSEAWYLHMRKNSVNVELGDTVAVGDTLGYVGSSGYSSGPHIHFEIQQNGTVDPYSGNCQTDTSRWIEQGEYVLNLPFEVMDNGLTIIPLDWSTISERPPTKSHVTAPSTIYSWLRLRNLSSSDLFTWEFYANGSIWDSYDFTPGYTYSSSWWYVYWDLPSDSSYYGDWEIKIFHNGSLIAEQPFSYDNEPNQLPIIEDTTLTLEMNSTIDGEFSAIDPDGNIFWYEIVSYPSNGVLTQYGGRKRKYTYIPNEDFYSQDTVIFYAKDDENAVGENGMYVFNVLENLSVRNNAQLMIDIYELSQNYPNPFNPVTTLRYDLPEQSLVNIIIYDIIGREVKTLVNTTQDAGSRSVIWDATNDAGSPVSAGIYLYRIQAGEFTQTKKMVLLK